MLRLFLTKTKYMFIKTAQKISSDTKEKVQLQLIMYDGGANTFQFNNPDGRVSQMADRDSVKELLQQLLPKFRRKLSSELEEKNRYFFFNWNNEEIALSPANKTAHVGELVEPQSSSPILSMLSVAHKICLRVKLGICFKWRSHLQAMG